MKKLERKDQNEKRRLAFEKRHVKKEMNLARYGAEGGSAFVVAKTTDFNRRLLAAFMALVFALATIVIGINFVARADDPVNPPSTNNNSNLVLDKTISAESNGTYTLQLSAYAKGKIKNVTEQIPTDFVLVLDQSGSMRTVDMPTDYVAANNGNEKNWTMSDFDNQALYIKDKTQENTFYRVYRKRGVMYEYQEPDSIYVKDVLNKLRWFQGETEQEQSTASQYYFRPSDVDPNPADGSGITLSKNGENVNVSDDDSFYHVDITSNGKFGYYAIKFSYDAKDGNTYYFVHPNEPVYKNPFGGKYTPGNRTYSRINDILLWYFNDNRCYSYGDLGFVNTGMYIRQPMYIRHASYSQLCYKDSNGIEHKLINTPYCDADGNPLGGACDERNDGKPAGNQTSNDPAYWNGVLYQPASNSTEERLLSLNKALKAFVDATAEQTDDYGKVDHRIAMVGFSSPGYNNTELLTGVPINSNNSMPSGGSSLDGYQHNGPQYSTSSPIQDSVYKTTLLSTTNEEDLDELNNAVDYITAYGGTQPALGLEMAKKIIDNREVTTYTRQSTQTTEPRRTVVIFFTDGTPGDYSTVGSDEFSNQYQEADKVVQAAYSIKSDPSTDTSIYSIGVFGESDGNPLMYHKATNQGSTEDSVDEALDSSMTEDDFSPYLAQVHVTTSQSGSGSWLNPYKYTSKRYYYFREHAEGIAGYPVQPNDTIADYMETVSSKYPEAQSFVYYNNKNQYPSYTSRIDAARGTTIDTSQRYYFMASDSASLSKVFTELSSSISESGVGLDLNERNSFLQDVISDNFILPSNPASHVTAQTFVGHQDIGETTPTFEQTPADTLSTEDIHFDNTTLKVYGFNYSDEYIAEGKSGKKLVVTITGLIPNGTGDNLASNSNTSGIMHHDNEDDPTTVSTVAEFTSPTLSRHKYVLNVGNDKPSATFDTIYTLVPNEGKTAADKSIILRNGSTANRYDKDNSIGQIGITGAANENTTYVEYITSGGKDGNANPNDYTLNAGVSTSDTAFTYYLSKTKYLYGTEQTDENKLQNVRSLSLDANIDGNLFVTSKANNHNITIKNETVKSREQDEDYSDPTKKFPIKLTLTKTDPNAPDITGPISGVTFTNGEGIVNLANDEEVTLTLPVGYSIKVEDESDPSAYSTTYKLDNDLATNTPTTTDTSADHTIIVRHERDKDTIATTGVTGEDGSNGFIYLLAGVGALTTGAGAAYVYRKKDEFVEQ